MPNLFVQAIFQRFPCVRCASAYDMDNVNTFFSIKDEFANIVRAYDVVNATLM